MGAIVLPHIREKLKEISENMCDGFKWHPQRASLRILNTVGEVAGTINNIDEARGIVTFARDDGKDTTYMFSEIVGIAT